MFKSSIWLIQCDFCRFFGDDEVCFHRGMDQFHIAAFVASSKLTDLSQNASKMQKKNTHQRIFFIFYFPLKRPKLLADAVLTAATYLIQL